MFTVDAILSRYYPGLAARPLLTTPIRGVLRRLLHEDRFVDFAEQYPHLRGMDFVEQVLETLQCTYTVAERERENIPASGRVMMKKLVRVKNDTLIEREREYEARLRRDNVQGDVELFG